MPAVTGESGERLLQALYERYGYDPAADDGAEDDAGARFVYDWATGETLSGRPGAEEAARNGRRMAERYRAWAETNVVTYTANRFESARRFPGGIAWEAFLSNHPL
jgi:hypothetical protein